MTTERLPWADVVAASATPLMVLDADARVVATNRALDELVLERLGTPPPTTLGELIRPADVPWAATAVTRLARGERGSFDAAIELAADPAPSAQLQLSLRRLDGAAGPGAGVGMVVGTLGPVAAATVRTSETLAERLLRHTGDNVTLVDATGKIVATKGMLTEIQGYPTSYWHGRYIWDLLPLGEWDDVADSVFALMNEPGAVLERDAEILAADGSQVLLSVRATNCLDDPLIDGFVVVTRDITEQQAAISELARRRRVAEAIADARNRLLATVSHELRNPLHAVRGLAELLIQEDLGDRATELASTLLRQVSGLTQVTQDLLDAARLDAGETVLTMAPVELRVLVDDVIGLGRTAVGSKPVLVDGTVDEPVETWFSTDGDRLRQVLVNLIGNAVKFTERGSVSLGVARRAGGGVLLTVSDTGVGIPADEQAAILEPFTVASTAGDSRGAGLGLSIVQRLVVAMDGELRIESNPGHGTRIEVELPLEPCDPPVAVAEEGGLRAGLRVLVVEDNPVNQQLARSQLERLGLVPVIAGTGEEGLTLLFGGDSEPFDVVLMDQQLPGWSGIETTERIRSAADPRSTVPVIGLSASASKADHEAFLAAGMDDFVAKPASLDDLSTAISRAVRHSSAAPVAATDTPGDNEAASAVDPDVLATLADELGGGEVVVELVDLFLSELDTRIGDIVDSVGDDAARAAHTLKSSARLLGVGALADACLDIERHGRERDDLREIADEARRSLAQWRAEQIG